MVTAQLHSATFKVVKIAFRKLSWPHLMALCGNRDRLRTPPDSDAGLFGLETFLPSTSVTQAAWIFVCVLL